MWRWTRLIYFFVLYRHSIPQPIINESENARHSRQLVAGECCPCPGSSQSSFDQQSAASFRQGMFDTAQSVDDCPCRHRSADTEGASSILFPNAIRAAGTFLKPANKKEDVKPLLHPEVDLASSVLKTLREATNEEYREALARDAVRDVVKIAGLSDSTFRDAIPEESKSIVTIIMNPKEDFESDGIPQASHLQESRCIHAPLGITRSSLGELKVESKAPLSNVFFNKAKARHPSLSHRNSMDMDSNIGASNIQEHVVKDDEELMNSRDAGLRTHVPLFKFKSKSRSNDDVRKSDLKNPLIPKIIKYPLGSSLLLNKKDKNMGNGNTVIKEFPNFRKPTLKYMLDSRRPLNLKQLLKLRDVELISSESFNKPTAVIHPTLNLPISNRKNQVDLASNSEKNYLNRQMIPENCSLETKEKQTRNKQTENNKPSKTELEIFDSIPNPSNTVSSVDNGQTADDDCENCETSNTDLNKSIVSMTTDRPISRTGINTNEPNESYKDYKIDEGCNSKITSASANPTLDLNEQDSESDQKHESLGFHERESDFKSDEDVSPKTTHDSDNNSPFSCDNSVEDHLDQQELYKEDNMVPEESSSRENVQNIKDDIVASVETSTTKYKSSKLLPLDKTLLSIKEKIQNTLGNLKNVNTDIQGLSEKNISNALISPIDGDGTHLSDIEVKPDSDCDKKSEQLITSLIPTTSDINIEKENKECNFVTIQELQKISDAMLQEELISDTNKAECGEKEKVTEERSSEKIFENNESESDNSDSEPSANTQNEEIMLPKVLADDIISKSHSDNMDNLCQSNKPTQKIVPKTADGDKIDVTEMDADASDIVINRSSQKIMPLGRNIKNPPTIDNTPQTPLLSSDPLSVFKTPLPDIHDILKLPPLPSLDDINLKISNLFNTNERNAQEDTSQEEYCASTSPNEFKSSMATDASTTNFQVKQPSLGSMNRENLNLDIFQLRPQYNSKAPTLGLDTFKTKLPSITDTNSVLGSRLSLFPNGVYATPKVSDIFDDIIEKLPNFENLRDRLRSNTQELLNTPPFLENIHDKLDLSDLRYHAENSLNNIKQKLKTVGNDFNIEKPMKNSHSFFDTLAEKQEDLSDKLRAVHIDLNDRLESMRNSLIKPTYLSNDRRNSNSQSFSNSNSMSKEQQLLMKSRTSQPVFNREETLLETEMQRKVKPIASQAIDQRKFKIPSAASMLVPKTVEIPNLKITPMKSTSPTVKDDSIFKSTIRSTEPPPVRSSTILARKVIQNLQNANKQLGEEHVKPFKNGKVTVSFSTTPRPLPSLKFKPKSTTAPISRLKSTARENTITDIDKNYRTYATPPKFKDSNGALSETKPWTILAPEENIDDRPRSELDEKDTPEEKTNPNLLQSWPQINDSSFLAKVKEAVNARLPKAKKLESENKKGTKIEDQPTVNFALRSASDNLEIIKKEPLQENVSYKCRMVCTRE